MKTALHQIGCQKVASEIASFYGLNISNINISSTKVSLLDFLKLNLSKKYQQEFLMNELMNLVDSKNNESFCCIISDKLFSFEILDKTINSSLFKNVNFILTGSSFASKISKNKTKSNLYLGIDLSKNLTDDFINSSLELKNVLYYMSKNSLGKTKSDAVSFLDKFYQENQNLENISIFLSKNSEKNKVFFNKLSNSANITSQYFFNLISPLKNLFSENLNIDIKKLNTLKACMLDVKEILFSQSNMLDKVCIADENIKISLVDILRSILIRNKKIYIADFSKDNGFLLKCSIFLKKDLVCRFFVPDLNKHLSKKVEVFSNTKDMLLKVLNLND